MGKKISWFVVLFVMLSLFLMLVPVANASTPTIIQGKVAQDGVLFFVLERQPASNNYEVVQQNEVLHDPDFELFIYNPDNVSKITVVSEEYMINSAGLPSNITKQNTTFEVPRDQMVEERLTVSLTENKEFIDIGINGTYYSSQEQFVAIPSVPFYETGELPYLVFIMVMSAVSIALSFGSALALLRRGKYFPPVKLVYVLVVAGLTAIAGEGLITSDYYQIIQTRWEYYFFPLYALFLLIFLSNIPSRTQKGLLLRFLSDRGNGEIRTQFQVIHTSEIELLELEGMRHSGMELINSRSYVDFLKRLIGIHVPIYFEQGELPSEIESPERLRIQKTLQFKLKNTFRFMNLKREASDFDFGYLLDQHSNPEVINIERNQIKSEIPIVKEGDGEQAKKKREVFRRVKRYRILKIPISGHHSKLMEEFLAGLSETEVKGRRIDELTLENAQLKAEIQSKTYYSQTDIIETMADQLTLSGSEVGRSSEVKTDGEN